MAETDEKIKATKGDTIGKSRRREIKYIKEAIELLNDEDKSTD